MDRRTCLTGAAAAAVARSALAAPDPHVRGSPPRLFARGPLAANPVAALFEVSPPLALPSTPVVDESGRVHRLGELRGRPTILSLWSEFCAPCLLEAPDLAALALRRPVEARVLALATDSLTRLNGPAARARLDRAGASGLPTWVEPAGGARVLAALAARPGDPGGALPCNLLLDRRGRVRGRSFGATLFPRDPRAYDHLEKRPDGTLTERGKAQLAAIPTRSLWATPAAGDFLRALAAGALEKV